VSREQLVDAYLRGEISRRVFVHRLVALGVSLGAAVTYAEVMPARARAADMYNLTSHPETPPSASPSLPSPPDHDTTPPSVGITAGPASRSSLARGGSLGIAVTLSEPGTANISVMIGGRRSGATKLNLPRGGSAHTALKLTRSGRRAVAHHRSLTLVVVAVDLAGNSTRRALSVALS
jgi:hypothetical protein